MYEIHIKKIYLKITISSQVGSLAMVWTAVALSKTNPFASKIIINKYMYLQKSLKKSYGIIYNYQKIIIIHIPTWHVVLSCVSEKNSKNLLYQ